MAESTIFLLLAGIGITVILYVLNITWIHPIFIIIVLGLLILPGIYAAIIGGPFVPSSRKRHKTMISLADLDPTDTLYDIGCGDGRLVFSSAPFVKRAIGYELSVPLYLFAKFRSLFNSKKATIRYGNIWKQNYKDADVIFCYLLPGSMKRFYKEIWPTLKTGTRVVSNAFQIHDIKPIKKEDKVYLYKK
ncbi:class I SAM-dependent methyltransferase [Patescibacteria group bacterium]|nr:class I SAM-dependent methyltransferase [Patescibacteria group bacterium]